MGIAIQAGAVLAAVTATLGYGAWQLRDDTFRPGPRIALIQGNFDQRIKNKAHSDADAGRDFENHFQALAQLAASEQYHADMIVWPETSFRHAWFVERDGNPSEDSRKIAEAVADDFRTFALLGLSTYEDRPDGEEWHYNSALLVTPKGEAAGRYDKIHRVIFGEYMPLLDVIPAIKYFSPYDHDYSIHPGEGHTRFPMHEMAGDQRPFTFGVVICYEDTDPIMARPYGGGDGKPAADFMINTSNDGWFQGSSEHDEHLAICRFRAVECRRSVARSVNMGISAVVDANGRVLKPQLLGLARPMPPTEMKEEELPRVWYIAPDVQPTALPVSEWHEYKKVQGVLVATIPLDERSSFYAQWGDWLPWLCWVLLAPAIVVISVRMSMGIVRFAVRVATMPFRRRVTATA